MLLFGAGDFSHGIGAPGQWDHPKITETRKRIAEVATAHGKFAGIVGPASDVGEYVDMGYSFVSIGADVIGISTDCRELLDEFAKQVSGK